MISFTRPLKNVPKILMRVPCTNYNAAVKVKRIFATVPALRGRTPTSDTEITGHATTKYKVFVDEESPVIYDVEQERDKFHEVNNETGRNLKMKIDLAGINPEVGVTGVIEIQELIEILHREKAKEIVVMKVPDELGYVDYVVVVTSRTAKQMAALAEFVRKVYKVKVLSNSSSKLPSIPVIEGKQSKDWKALDLGNIALHMMSESAREFYDLESLWSVGPEYDLKCRAEVNMDDLAYSDILSDLVPLSNK